jgi:hypothetical protein
MGINISKEHAKTSKYKNSHKVKKMVYCRGKGGLETDMIHNHFRFQVLAVLIMEKLNSMLFCIHHTIWRNNPLPSSGSNTKPRKTLDEASSPCHLLQLVSCLA